MDKLYYVIGFIVIWGMIITTACYVLYILFIYFHVLKLWVRTQNWYNFHIERNVISTDILRHKFLTPWIMAVSGNGYWILMYRLRNIRRAKRKDMECKHCGSSDFYVHAPYSNHNDFYEGAVICNNCGNEN